MALGLYSRHLSLGQEEGLFTIAWLYKTPRASPTTPLYILHIIKLQQVRILHHERTRSKTLQTRPNQSLVSAPDSMCGQNARDMGIQLTTA